MKIYSFSKILGLTILTASLIGSTQIGFAQSSSPTEKIDLFESNSSGEESEQQGSGIINYIQSIAEKITIRIDYGSNNGSGVIVARDGNRHYVLTAKHVLKGENESEYKIVAPDGQTYLLDYSKVKKFPEADLAVLEFQSLTPYDVATLANFEQRAAVHQAKKANANIDPSNPNRILDLEAKRRMELVKPIINDHLLNIDAELENACPEEKNALEAAPSAANAELYSKCLEETILSGKEEEIKRKGQELGLNNQEMSLIPNIPVDYRLSLLFLYGWPKENSKPQKALISIGGYHRSNLGDAGSAAEIWIKYGSAANLPSPSSEFIDSSNDADNFNKNSQNYDIFYTNRSYGGMSGGPVLDYNGNLVAIHTGLEGENRRIKLRESIFFLGYSNGIFVDKFINKADILGIEASLLNIEDTSQNNIDWNEIKAVDLTIQSFYEKQQFTSKEDWINYGNQMWRIAKHEEAAKAFDEAIKIDPKSYLAYYGKGKSLAILSIDQDEHIVELYRKATELNPDFYAAWKELGDHLHNLELNDVMKIRSLPSDEWRQAYEELMQPKVAEALNAYETALALNPDNAYLYSRIGQMHFMQNNCPQALSAFDKAISINPSNVFHKYKSLVYMAMGNFDKAQSEYEIYFKDKTTEAPPGMFPYQVLFEPSPQEREKLIKKQLSIRLLDRC